MSRNRAFGGSERACYPTLLKEVVRWGRTAPGEPQCRTRDGAAGRVRRRRTHAARFPCGTSGYLLRTTKAALRVERQSPHGIAAAGSTRCAKKSEAGLPLVANVRPLMGVHRGRS